MNVILRPTITAENADHCESEHFNGVLIDIHELMKLFEEGTLNEDSGETCARPEESPLRVYGVHSRDD
jgi:hypothetical protein